MTLLQLGAAGKGESTERDERAPRWREPVNAYSKRYIERIGSDTLGR